MLGVVFDLFILLDGGEDDNVVLTRTDQTVGPRKPPIIQPLHDVLRPPIHDNHICILRNNILEFCIQDTLHIIHFLSLLLLCFLLNLSRLCVKTL